MFPFRRVSTTMQSLKTVPQPALMARLSRSWSDYRSDGVFVLRTLSMLLVLTGIACVATGVVGVMRSEPAIRPTDPVAAATVDEVARSATAGTHVMVSLGVLAAGGVLLLLSAAIQTYGIAPLRSNSRSLATIAAVVTCSDDAIIGEALDGRILSWNPAAERIYGYRAEEVIGKRLPALDAPQQFAAAEMRDAAGGNRASGDPNAAATGSAADGGPRLCTFDMQFDRRDGRQIDISLSISPIRDSAGQVIGISKIGRDITDRKRAERALRENQERFELAIRGSNDALGDWNLATGESYWSPRLSEMLGYSPEEFGSTFDSISTRLHPDDRDRVLDDLAERIRLGQQAKAEFRLLTKSGSYCWVQGRGQAVYDAAGRPYRFVGAITDISERKQMEAEIARRDELLRQSHKLQAVGSLAGGISHEFNNLLQVIRGYGQYAMNGLEPGDQRYDDLEQVIHAADRAAALTQQLLGFSRLQVLETTTFDHREVVSDLAKLLRPLIGEHIELEIELAPDACAIRADRGLLQQMLLNLCINARDSMPTGGRLSLKTQRIELSQRYCEFHPDVRPGAYVLFSIADTGCGMPPEVKSRIFEPFFTTKGVGKGTGLGLAMVYGGVQQHGGMINVYSEVGIGTTFTIHLPAAMSADSPNKVEQFVASKGGSETILIAEDETMVRDLAVRILKGAGYSVVVAADGAEAVNLFHANAGSVSLVILDAIMPKMTGHEAYDRIQLANPAMPAIFCSGYDPETGLIKSLMDHGCRLIQKPYDPELLLTTVREVLDQSHSLQASLCNA